MIKGADDGMTVLDFTRAWPAACHDAAGAARRRRHQDRAAGRRLGPRAGRVKGDHCAHSVAFNRGKRSIALDLKSADGKAVVNKLTAKANVVIESFRPGVISRLGFGYEDAKKVNPKVVTARCRASARPAPTASGGRSTG